MNIKAFLIWTCSFLLLDIATISAQSWIGTQFRLDTSISFHYNHIPDISGLRGCIADNTLYFTSKRSFQENVSEHAAIVFALSLKDYSQRELRFPFPGSKKGHDFFTSSFWIYDLDIKADKAVFAAQNYLVVYEQANGQYHFKIMYYRPNAIAVYFHQGRLYYFIEDHDKGYRWYCLNESGGQDKFIRELPYEVPHVVQAVPNRYLFHDQQFVFFLSTRHPVLHKYTLAGDWVEDISFDLPYWHPFEDEYIQKSLSYPYGPERIYGTMAEIFNYSYPKVVFPLQDHYLLYYTQYDTAKQKSVLQFAIRNRDGHTIRYICHDNDTTEYSGGRFPFNLFEPYTDKLHLSDSNRLIEICYESAVPWHGLTPKQYKEASETFFKYNEPIPTVRIHTYKNNDSFLQPFFYNSKHDFLSLNDLKKKKAVMMITQQLECSACEKRILDQFNQIDTNTMQAAILYPFIPGALQERELKKSAEKTLTQPFNLFFLATDRQLTYPTFISQKVTSFPAVMFLEPGKAPVFISANDLFTDNDYYIELSDTFNKVWEDFCHEPKPTEK